MALNYLARATLVPDVISQLSPLTFVGACDFAQYLYEKVWDIKAVNPIDDLKARGFNPDTLSHDVPHYYAARDSLAMWKILETFVKTVVDKSYDGDTSIKADVELQAWVKELNEKVS
jgi:hypothetical protein